MEQNERIDSAAGEPVSACKRRKHLRLAALAVSCALLGGIAGGAATGLLLQGREDVYKRQDQNVADGRRRDQGDLDDRDERCERIAQAVPEWFHGASVDEKPCRSGMTHPGTG